MECMELLTACFTASTSNLRLLIANTFPKSGRLPKQRRMLPVTLTICCPFKGSTACDEACTISTMFPPGHPGYETCPANGDSSPPERGVLTQTAV